MAMSMASVHGDQAAKSATSVSSHMAHQGVDVGNGKAEAKGNGKRGGEKNECPENKAAANEEFREGEDCSEGPRQSLGQHMVAEYRIDELLWIFKFGEARNYEEPAQRQPQQKHSPSVADQPQRALQPLLHDSVVSVAPAKPTGQIWRCCRCWPIILKTTD